MEGTQEISKIQLIRQDEAQIKDIKDDKAKAIDNMELRIKNLDSEIERRKNNYLEMISKTKEDKQAALSDLEIVLKSKLDSDRKNYLIMEQRMKDNIERLKNKIRIRNEEQAKELLDDNGTYTHTHTHTVVSASG